MRKAIIAILGFLLFGSGVNAFEVYEKNQDKLLSVKWCDPANGQALDKVVYISCSSQNDQKMNASTGSSCTNYQSDSCGPPPNSPPAMTDGKSHPWNYFDKSKPEQTVVRPTGWSPTAAMDNEQNAGKDQKKKKVKKRPENTDRAQ